MPSKEKSDMRTLRELFENNKAWADGMIAEDPDFFTRLS
jgi:hypothetical protein